MAWRYPLMERLAAAGPADDWLTGHGSVDPALGRAWDTAEAGGRRRLIGLLLRRGRPEGHAALIRRWDQLDAASRAELAGQVNRLAGPLRKVAVSTDSAAQAHALALVAAANAGGFGYLAIEKLRSDTPAVRAAASATLAGLVEGVEAMPPRAASGLADAVGEAVARYRAGRSGEGDETLLRAWLGLGSRVLARDEPDLSRGRAAASAALGKPEHPAVGPMRALLSGAAWSGVRRGLVVSLGFGPLAGAAVAGLRRCFAGEFGEAGWAEALAGQEHVMALPAVGRALSRTGGPEGLTIDAAERRRAGDPAGRRAYAAWVGVLPLTERGRATRWAAMSDDPDAGVRLAVLRRMTETPGSDPRAAEVVRRAAAAAASRDPDAAVARLAAAWLLADRGRAEACGGELMRSDHAAVRALAERHRRRDAFDRLWHGWPRWDAPQRRAAAAEALRLDPAATRRLRRSAERGGDARRRALEIVVTAERAGLLRGPRPEPTVTAGDAA
ncbi:MAG: hypothetical protein AAF710_09920 [Planctomycetota bacterium]